MLENNTGEEYTPLCAPAATLKVSLRVAGQKVCTYSSRPQVLVHSKFFQLNLYSVVLKACFRFIVSFRRIKKTDWNARRPESK